MFVFTAKFSKKKLLLPIVVLVAAVLGVLLLTSGSPEEPAEAAQVLTNENRVEYLRSWGWEVTAEPLETLQFLLPEKLQEPYASYAELQDSQGFDFAACRGKQVARYTYAVTNYPGRDDVQVNLYVCEGYPAGGDIFCAGADGFQATLVYPEES